MRLPMVDCRSLIEFCRAFEQHKNKMSHNSSNNNNQSQRGKKYGSSNSVNPLSHPFCDRSPFAALDIFILILVLGSLGFLIIPYFSLILREFLAVLPTVCEVVGEVVSEAPVAYLVGLVAAFSGVIATIAAWEFLELKSRKCGNRNCKGLRKAVEFDIQLESEECVKYLPPGSTDYGVKPLELGQDHKELEAELKKMAPLNGRTVLIFRAPCGCPAGRLEVWGSKRIRLPLPNQNMAGKPIAGVIFFAFFFFSLCSSKPIQYQTLIPKSLPQPASLPFNDQFHDSYSQTLTESDFESTDSTTLSVHLHHVDAFSIISNSTLDPERLFKLRLHRDAKRVAALTSISAAAVGGTATPVKPNATRAGSGTDFSSSVISGLAQGSGEYFTRIGVGTPPRYAYMVLDTGSDVVWIQCSPCRKCYTQSDPVFDPTKSTTFAGITCDSPVCRRLDSRGCNNRQKCLYQVSYGDGSFTFGEFSTETLTFRRTKVSNIAFGCGHDNEGLFVGAAGLLGLGRGRLSFPNQAGRRFGSKFSYCLVDRSASSKPSSLVFGNGAVSRLAVFTPLLTNPKLDTFYYIGLTGVSVGGVKVPGFASTLAKLDTSGNGGVIIDSGTSVTRFNRPAYIALRDAFLAGATDLKRAPDFSLFDTCFDLSGKTEVKVPTVVMHFTGADVSLPASNYLIPVDSGGRFCFAFAGTTSGLSIIGNIQQQGFRVVYDLAGSRVGFAPRGCA